MNAQIQTEVQRAIAMQNSQIPGGSIETGPRDLTLRIRGRAMWFKSLDQDMTVAYSDHTYAGKK